MKTKSLWYTGTERLEVREMEIPEPGPAEALVEVEACGVCTWDLFIYSGGFQKEKAFPFCFGHEGIGRVLAVGPEARRLRADLAPGRRVALRESPEIGRPGTAHMARHAVLPERMLIPLPEAPASPAGWLVEPVACCVNALDRAAVRGGERVALVGAGFMGNILLQGLIRTPHSRLAVFDVKQELLDRARAIDREGILELHDARLDGGLDGAFDLVIETSAAESGFRLANRLVKRGGRLVIFSWHHHPFPIDLGHWHVNGISVLNVSPAAHPRFDECFPQAIDLIAAGRIEVAGLVTHIAPPEEAQALYEKGLRKTDGYLKGMIRWS